MPTHHQMDKYPRNCKVFLKNLFYENVLLLPGSCKVRVNLSNKTFKCLSELGCELLQVFVSQAGCAFSLIKEKGRNWWWFFSTLDSSRCLPGWEKLHGQIANLPSLSLNSIRPSGKKQCVAFIHRISPVDMWSCLMGFCFLPHWAVTDQGARAAQVANCLSL